MKNHTQGAWVARHTPRDTDFKYEIASNDGVDTIAAIYRHSDEVDGNAQLIETAPELLSALVRLTNWARAHDAISFIEENDLKAAEAAINKAIGKKEVAD